MLLPFQEITAIATAVGATITAVLKGHEAYEKFKHKKKVAKRKRRPRKKPDIPAGRSESSRGAHDVGNDK